MPTLRSAHKSWGRSEQALRLVVFMIGAKSGPDDDGIYQVSYPLGTVKLQRVKASATEYRIMVQP